MKKYPLIVIIASLLSPGICADLQAQPGVRIGMSFSALLSSNADDFRPFLGHEVEWIQYGESRPVWGVQLGLFYSFHLSDYFDLQPQINFIQRGYWYDHTPLYDTRYKIRINYLELPLIIRYKMPIHFIPFNIHAGPFAAVKLSAKGHIDYEGIDKTEPLGGVSDFDYGMLMGFGSEFKVGTGRMLIDLQFSWGLHNMMSQPDDYIDLYADPGQVRNLSLIFLTGYRLRSSNRVRE